MRVASVLWFIIFSHLCVVLIDAAAKSNDDGSMEKNVSKLDPIVIKTPERNYDEPNLNDLNQCSDDRNSCINSCEINDNTCLDKCPKCPILVVQDTVIQGINDTDHNIPSPKSINSTNIIRVTNEIRNVIDNNLGNVISRNENNIKIYQKNKTTTGGDYGLGYDENGPCCMVVAKRKSRQRLCGSRCKARVMYARPIVHCSDETDLASCTQAMEYKPYRPRKQHYSSGNSCQYQSDWPFVSCRKRRNNRACSPMCLELAYGYILQHGVPLHCVNCFKSFHKTSSYIPPMGYAPDDDFGIVDDDDWNLEKTKCRLADGTISEDCDNEPVGSGDDEFILQSGSQMINSNDQFDPYDSYYIEADGTRRRRHAFRRSKYTLRHKKEENKLN